LGVGMVEGSKDNQHEKQGDQTKAEGHHVGFCNGMGSNVEQFLWAALWFDSGKKRCPFLGNAAFRVLTGADTINACMEGAILTVQTARKLSRSNSAFSCLLVLLQLLLQQPLCQHG